MAKLAAKEYTLYAPRGTAAFEKPLIFGLFGLFILVGIWMIVELLKTNESFVWIGVLWLAAVAYATYTYLGLPYSILWRDDGMVGFKSILRTFTVAPNEITSIVPESWPVGFLIVRTQKGKLRLPPHLDEFHEFLARLESINPRVELRGC